MQAIEKYKKVFELFAGDEVALQAKKEIKALEKHPKVKNEKRALFVWKQILSYSQMVLI